jgi:hypothetical protein
MNKQIFFFFGCTLGLEFVLFVVFVGVFERKLQKMITNPIHELAEQIKDPAKLTEAKKIAFHRDSANSRDAVQTSRKSSSTEKRSS